MKLNQEIFREYDIRGIVGQDLDEEVMELLGKAYTTYLRGKKKYNTVVVGRDGRLSGKAFANAVIDGITACGVNVIDIGEVPSPVLYYALNTLKVDGGLMLTASHNPKEYNGMKVGIGKTTIFGKEIQKLYKIAMAGGVFGGEEAGDDYAHGYCAGVYASDSSGHHAQAEAEDCGGCGEWGWRCGWRAAF